MVWNEELKREIPAGWKSGTIANIGKVFGGATPATSNTNYYSSNGIAWATPKDLASSQNLYFSHGQRDITEEGFKSCSSVLIPSGSVLMTSRAPIGYLAINCNEVCTNQGFKSVVPNLEVGPYFVFHTLKLLMPYIKKLGNGSTFAEVSGKDLEGIPVLIPSTDCLQKFNSLVEPLFKKVQCNEQESTELSSLRDYLLPLLMNGQATISD